MRPVVYTQRVEVVSDYRERRDCADQRIAAFIGRCGFLPVPLPNISGLAAQIIRCVHPAGILLTGGNSLEKYGGNAPERDAMDRVLIALSIECAIPLYGFCRGMQSILDYFGCELSDVDGHAAVRHPVFEGAGRYEVNSYHRQACRRLAADCGLRISARAEDGVIEAVVHEAFPIAAVMWHPEREQQTADRDIRRVKMIFQKGRHVRDEQS